MHLKQFNEEQYKLNHPAGKIGRQLLLKVKDLMLTGAKLPLCKPEDKLVDVLVELSNKQCGCLLVVDHQMVLKGIFTDGDLRRSLQKHGPEALKLSMQKLMTGKPRVTHSDLLAVKALKSMESDPKKPITVLAVVDPETHKTVGLIKMHDILQSGI